MDNPIILRGAIDLYFFDVKSIIALHRAYTMTILFDVKIYNNKFGRFIFFLYFCSGINIMLLYENR